ncbi:hypothetical protein Slin15195_G047950 [Septoria linicola]|uniref:Uncharacterized protein n=1 Tax=Septoria linicola TaxID=215465 RepID=A0A9Q9AVJ3_9PEZI|nr:hypothetical protein Slin14017_G051490 [Septoria linicola]USW51476.1 hypothetical protein Slin15195_G047950 [Septoria linicola]
MSGPSNPGGSPSKGKSAKAKNTPKSEEEKRVQPLIKDLKPKMDLKFMVRENHLYQRGYSKMLHTLEPYHARPAGEEFKLRSASKPRKHKDVSDYVQDVILNAVIREHEVAALALSGKQDGFADENKQHFTILLQPTITVAINPRSDDQSRLPPIRDDEPALQQLKDFAMEVRSASTQIDGLNQASDVVQFVLDRFRECRKHRSKDYLFSQHMSFFLHLLRQCHLATDKQELEMAVQRLREYVFVTSYGKMVRRLNLGKGERKLYDILVKDLDTFADAEHDLPVSSTFRKPPNPKQAQIIRKILLNAQGGEGFTKEAVEACLQSPLYDAHGRNRFHFMLRLLLKRVNTTLQKLRDIITAFKKAQDSDGEPDRAEIATDVAQAVGNLRNLQVFLHSFDDIMIPHLTWVAQVSGVDREGLSPDWSRPSSALPTTPQPAQPPAPTPSPSASTVNVGSTDDDEEAELNYIALKYGEPQNRWAAVAHKYLKLICLHEISLRGATRFDPAKKNSVQRRQSELVLNAQVSVVEVRYQTPDKSRASIKDCLKVLHEKEPELKIDFLETWFSQVPSDEKDALTKTHGFDGVIHCESILMSFMAAIRDEELLQYITADWLVKNDGFAVEKSLLEMFVDWLPLMHVSKRCCPPCWKLLQLMEAQPHFFKAHKVEEGPVKMEALGQHSVWTSVALPAWCPKQLAEGVLRFHEDETIKRLLKIQEDAAQCKHILSDPTTAGSPMTDDEMSDDGMVDVEPTDDEPSAPTEEVIQNRMAASPLPHGQSYSPFGGSSSSGSSALNTPTRVMTGPDASGLPDRSRRLFTPTPDASSSSQYLDVPEAGPSMRVKHRRAENDTWDAENELPDKSTRYAGHGEEQYEGRSEGKGKGDKPGKKGY